MAQPTPYTQTTDFSDYQVSNPNDPLSGASIDVELAALKVTTDEILVNLAILQKDDTTLANQSVGFAQLKSEVSTGINAPTVWATSTAYVVGDAVFAGTKMYRCITAHTSQSAITDDTAKWLELADFGTINGVLNGSGAPGNALGSNGNFYIDSTNWVVYGPKASDVWPAGTSMVGPAGPGSGDMIGPGTTVDKEICLFDGTTGTATERATGTGFVKVLSGVYQAPAATIGTSEIADEAVTYAKMQHVSATDKVLGRSTAGAGDVEEIPCTAFARTLLDDPDQATMQTTLGVNQAAVAITGGTAAFSNGSAASPSLRFQDSTTGFYRATADQIAVSVSGSKVWEWNSSGELIGFGNTLKNMKMRDFSFDRQDKGTVSSGTVTFNIEGGNYQKLTVGGNLTLAFSNWAASGEHCAILLFLTNAGAHTITWPSINWLKADGTGDTDTSFSNTGYTLHSSGVDFVLVWTEDGGTTLYGKVVR